MSLVIAVFAVIIVATLIARYYPHPKPTNTLAEGEMLTPDVKEQIQESATEEAPKPKKRGPKPKAQGTPKTTAAKKPKKKDS